MDLDDEEGARFAIVEDLDTGVRRVAAPLVPARALVAGLLVATMLVAAPALLDDRTGAAPGVMNGSIAWAIDGDIVVGDPVTGLTRTLVAGPGIDRNPLFAPDGSRLAFLRQVPTGQRLFDLYVSGADGSAVVMVSAVPMAMPAAVVWTIDGSSLLVNEPDGSLFLYPTHGSPSRLLVEGVHLDAGALRPPAGAEVLYRREADSGTLYVMARDGSRARMLAGPPAETCSCAVAGPARWSPDGRMIALAIRLDEQESRLYVMDADGTELRRLTDEAGPGIEEDPIWSPLGDRIAFNRWQRDGGDWQVRPIGIVAVEGGPVQPVGVAPAAEGALIEWSPDGRSILSLPKTLIDAYASYPNGTGSVARPVIIDIADGALREFDWSVGSIASWQRRQP